MALVMEKSLAALNRFFFSFVYDHKFHKMPDAKRSNLRGIQESVKCISVFRRSDSEAVVGSIPTVATRSLLAGSVSV